MVELGTKTKQRQHLGLAVQRVQEGRWRKRRRKTGEDVREALVHRPAAVRSVVGAALAAQVWQEGGHAMLASHGRISRG